MAINGKLLVDNEPVLSLVMYGVGAFQAFTGNEIYRNRGGCTAVAEKGPLPAGRYWIVQRPVGGLRSQLKALSADVFNALQGAATNRSEWFGLYRDDVMIDDWTWINGVKRGNFRLHPAGGGGNSFGCITLVSRAAFAQLREALLNTVTIPIPNSKFRAYGTIEVITYGDTCP